MNQNAGIVTRNYTEGKCNDNRYIRGMAKVELMLFFVPPRVAPFA